jgi:hypothetical protein
MPSATLSVRKRSHVQNTAAHYFSVFSRVAQPPATLGQNWVKKNPVEPA